MPYLNWDTYRGLKRRNALIADRLVELQLNKGKNHLSSLSSQEEMVIWYYLVEPSNLPIHHRRSLDQYGYPNLRSTKTRDDDQVLHKRTSIPSYKCGISTPLNGRLSSAPAEKNREGHKRNKSNHDAKQAEEHGRESKVIIVDQLWLWITDPRNCLTFFSKATQIEDETKNIPADLRNGIISDINGDPRFAQQCNDVFEFAAFVVAHTVRVFLEDIESEDLQIFRIFEEYISILTERQTMSFKTFRNRYQQQEGHLAMHNPSARLSKTLTKLQQDDIKDNEHDLTDLLELRDIEDELGTMKKLFKDQLRVIDQLVEQRFNSRQGGVKGLEILREARSNVESYHREVDEMLANCNSAQESVRYRPGLSWAEVAKERSLVCPTS